MKQLLWVNTPSYSARPSTKMTNSQWQQKFQIMKVNTIPSKEKKLISCVGSSRDYGLTGGDYQETAYVRYKQYINDVLRTIRMGHEDYCYFTYQIKELLRFEHERLKTRYIPSDQLWIVWLDGGIEE